VVHEGDHVQVKILKIERGDDMRIGLSMKETMEDPWDAAVSELHVGKKVTGTVTRLEPFGAFVEVLPNVEGLVHVSEMSWEKHVKNPGDIVSVGQQVSVEVQDIDLARRRISLSMKGAAGDPWNNIDERYRVGQEVTGTVENVEDFGAFVSLGSGITALIPRSEMGLGRGSTPHSRFSKGNEVTARVLSIEPQRRRMALTMKSAEEVGESEGSAQRSWSEGSKGLGTLGDLLKDKLKDS
jgi:small subunit ribosomal protein S1